MIAYSRPIRRAFNKFLSSRLYCKSRRLGRWAPKAQASRGFCTVAHICHGKTYFSTAKLTFPRQNLLFYGKTYFSTAKLTFSRQNLLSHGKTYFSIPSFQSVSAYAFPRWRSGNFQQSNMADGEEDYVWVIHALFKSMSVCNSRQTLSLV